MVGLIIFINTCSACFARYLSLLIFMSRLYGISGTMISISLQTPKTKCSKIMTKANFSVRMYLIDKNNIGKNRYKIPMHRCQLPFFIPKALVVTFRLKIKRSKGYILVKDFCHISHTLPSSTQFSAGDFDRVNLTYPSISPSP